MQQGKYGKHYENLVGQKFGKLAVVRLVRKEDGRRHPIFAVCDCECGNSKEMRADMVSRYVSCGCHATLRENLAGKNPSFKGVGELRGTHIWEIKKSAKKRGIEYSVTNDYLWSLYENQSRKSALTNLPIRFGRVYFPEETTASLDRIDNNRGYVEGNVRWVLKSINLMKNAHRDEDFILLCNLVATHHPRIVQQLLECDASSVPLELSQISWK